MIYGIHIYHISNNGALGIVSALLLYIPISEICIQTINYILSKITKPMLIPKLDLSMGIPKEYSTFVIIPTLLKSKEKVKELIHKLEVYSLANKSENIYFALLGDSSESSNEDEAFDNEIIKMGVSEVRKLNEKYNVSAGLVSVRTSTRLAPTKISLSI